MNNIFSKYNPNSKTVFNDNKWISNELNSSVNERIKDHKHFVDFVLEHKLNDITVLDFGGSFGYGYFAIKNQVAVKEYNIVEVEKICTIGTEKFDEDKLFFSNTVPDKKFDIVYCRTALQYVDNWVKLIQKILSLHAKYVFFCHLSAGNIPTFLASQRYYDNNITYWFINIDELKDTFTKLGYNELFRRECTPVSDDLYDNSIDSKIKSTIDIAFTRGSK